MVSIIILFTYLVKINKTHMLKEKKEKTIKCSLILPLLETTLFVWILLKNHIKFQIIQ